MYIHQQDWAHRFQVIMQVAVSPTEHCQSTAQQACLGAKVSSQRKGDGIHAACKD